MKKILFSFFLSLTIITSFSSCDTLGQVITDSGVLDGAAGGTLSTAEIGRGLKEALQNGITKGANQLSLKDGFYKSIYKILLPEEVQTVTKRLKNVPGFTNLEEQLLQKINEGAEDAAKEAAPIFINAIKSMTFNDALNILMGNDNAATEFLQRTTTEQLYNSFSPKITNSLNKIGAADIWKSAATTYNGLPLISKKVNPDLSDHVTTQALKGLFSKVAEEEKNIRRNKTLRTTDLLQRVFAKQDTNRQ